MRPAKYNIGDRVQVVSLTDGAVLVADAIVTGTWLSEPGMPAATGARFVYINVRRYYDITPGWYNESFGLITNGFQEDCLRPHPDGTQIEDAEHCKDITIG